MSKATAPQKATATELPKETSAPALAPTPQIETVNVVPIPTGARDHKSLSPSYLGLAEHKQKSWVAEPAPGTPYENLFIESYWAHHASKFDRGGGELIWVRARDGRYLAELYVMEAGSNWARVKELRKYELSPTGRASGASDYSVEYRGDIRKWTVIGLRDKQVVRDGFTYEDQARSWAINHQAGRA